MSSNDSIHLQGADPAIVPKPLAFVAAAVPLTNTGVPMALRLYFDKNKKKTFSERDKDFIVNSVANDLDAHFPALHFIPQPEDEAGRHAKRLLVTSNQDSGLDERQFLPKILEHIAHYRKQHAALNTELSQEDTYREAFGSVEAFEKISTAGHQKVKARLHLAGNDRETQHLGERIAGAIEQRLAEDGVFVNADIDTPDSILISLTGVHLPRFRRPACITNVNALLHGLNQLIPDTRTLTASQMLQEEKCVSPHVKNVFASQKNGHHGR